MPYKFKSLFSLPLIILGLDNIASAIVIPVLMKSLYPCGIDGHCQINSISDNVIIFSALVYLLSPSYLFASPIVGQLADVYGRKITLIGCLFISVAGYLVSLAANIQHSVFLILLAILLLNASSSSMQVVQAIAADVSENRKKSHYFSLIAFVMMPLYFTFASTIEHFLKNISSMNNIIILCALVITFINLIALHYYYPRNIHGKNHQINELIFAESVNNFSINVWKLLALFAVFEFGSSLYFESIMNYLAENHSYLIDSSTLLIYRMLAMTLGILFIYPLFRKYLPNALIMLISISVCCIGMLGSLLINTLFFQIFCLLIFTIGEIIFLPTIWSLLSDETLAKHQGLIMGIKGAIWSLAWSLGLLASNKIELLFSSIYPIIFAIIITAICLVTTKYFLKILRT